LVRNLSGVSDRAPNKKIMTKLITDQQAAEQAQNVFNQLRDDGSTNLGILNEFDIVHGFMSPNNPELPKDNEVIILLYSRIWNEK
jgi:hypothetical protein